MLSIVCSVHDQKSGVTFKKFELRKERHFLRK